MWQPEQKNQIRIKHRSLYRYSGEVQLHPHTIYLFPRIDYSFRILRHNLAITPESDLRWGRDVYENVFAILPFSGKTAEFDLNLEIDILVNEQDPFHFLLSPKAAGYPFQYEATERKALQAYLETRPADEATEVLSWIYRTLPEMPESTMTILSRINSAIHQGFSYRVRHEEGTQSPNNTIHLGSGTCRDFAWLFIHACRQMGFAARFVSGYLAESVSKDHPMEDRASGELHAWAEVYLPGAGWKGFDPTNGILSTHHFVPTAVAVSPQEVAPVQGTFSAPDGVESTLEVHLEAILSAP